MPRSRVIIKNIDVSLQRAHTAFDGVRIAHASDLHLSRWNRTLRDAQATLMHAEFDVLCVTGDFGTFRRVWKRSADLTREFFDPIANRRPIYAVLGNHDHPGIAREASPPLTFLRNTWTKVTVGASNFFLVGVDPLDFHLSELMADLPSNRTVPTLMLAHYPSTVFQLPAGNVDLMLSGHTHGGQIRIPYLGCLWANDRIPRRMARGLHCLPMATLHVSPGIGRSLPIPLRINCPPEITILTLRTVENSPLHAPVTGPTRSLRAQSERAIPAKI